MRTLIVVLLAIACTPAAHDVGETLTESSTTPTETTETAGVPVCEPPQWFQCPGTDICDVQPCEAGLGLLDENGCAQISCTANEDCAEGQRCFDTVIAGIACESSGPFCAIEDGTCGCGINDDCTVAARCVPEREATAQECPTEGLDCDGLFGFMDSLTATYQQRLSAQQFELAASIGSCAQEVEGEVLADPELCERTLCGEICRLHPCELPASDCEAACEAAATELDEAQLRAIALDAAGSPGLCTCDVCEADSFGFCETVWGCQMG